MAGTSEHAVLVALRAVVRDHGWQVAGDPARLRGMLSDVLGQTAGEHRGAVDALVVSAQEGVPDEIRAAGSPGLAAIEPDLVAQLEDWGMTSERAAWVVRAWAGLAPEPTTPPPVTAEPEAAEPEAPEPAPDPANRTSPDPTTLPPVVDATSMPPVVDATSMPPVVDATTLPPVVDATTLPPARAPGEAVATGPVPGPTEESGRSVGAASRGRRAVSARTLVAAALAAVVLAGAGVAGALALSGDPDPDPASATPGSTSSPTATGSPSEPTAASGTELVAAPEVRPERASGTFAMAARTGGVRIARFSTVPEFGRGDAVRSRPEGGRLVAFRLADWKNCDIPPCRPWSELGLAVAVGSDLRRLPERKGDTYVVAVPAGTKDVDLVLRADGHRQTLSLLTGRPGRDNIAVLARNRKDRSATVDRRLPVTERTSIVIRWPDLTEGTSTVRSVTVRSAELHFFFEGEQPRSPGSAYLVVDATYTVPWDSIPHVFRVEETTFRGGDGTVYRAKDVDPRPDKVHAVFEVPADLAGGSLIIAGQVPVVADNGVPYTVTLERAEVPIRLS